jgi:hypothetical protein
MVNDQHTSVVHEDKQREDDANLDKPHVHINLQDYQLEANWVGEHMVYKYSAMYSCTIPFWSLSAIIIKNNRTNTAFPKDELREQSSFAQRTVIVLVT